MRGEWNFIKLIIITLVMKIPQALGHGLGSLGKQIMKIYKKLYTTSVQLQYVFAYKNVKLKQ